MRRFNTFSACLLALSTTVLWPGGANAGEVLRATPESKFEWRSTECRKPIQNTSPTLSTQESLEQYSKDITEYLGCLQLEAQRDFNASQALMQAAIERELAAETKRMDEMIKRAYRTRR